MNAGWKRWGDGSVHLAIPIPESNADHWALVRILAAVLRRSGADLDDDVACVRTLLTERLLIRDFSSLLDEAVDLARHQEGGE